jgi:hypothetical protein
MTDEQQQQQEEEGGESALHDSDMADTASAEGSEEDGQQDTGPDHISRNYWVGGGICLARLRLQHLLLHWPYKVRHSRADNVHGFSCWPSAILRMSFVDASLPHLWLLLVACSITLEPG